jgi:hypothetical protein
MAMSNKHPRGGPEPGDKRSVDTPRPPDDLARNPGIGASKGTTRSGTDPEALAGESTSEGDVMNDTTRQGGVNPDQRGRTNR